MRREKDALGELEVPENAYYGIQTVRCASNYPISDHTYNEYPEIIKAVAQIKIACAKTNCEIGALSAEKAVAIIQAANEIINGQFSDQFPVNVWRSQGTGVNMNVNEVIANRANEILTGHKGYDAIHPNSHVNMCQSSNDVFPTAELIVIHQLTEPLIQKTQHLEEALSKKAQEFQNAIRLGRTGFQDAVPMTWGQVFGGWQCSIRRVRIALESFRETLNEGVLGGTAVGTGMGQLPGYSEKIYKYLSDTIGYPIHLASMPGEVILDSAVFDGMRNTDHHFILMGYVKSIIASVARIAHDVRTFSSGPRTGLCELVIPTNGSSITGYPGENICHPCEVVIEALGETLSSEKMTFLSSTEGQLDHSSQNSAGIIGAIDAIKLTTEAIEYFQKNCIEGISINKVVCRKNAELSTSLSTMVSSLFGYPVGTKIAKTAIARNISCKQAALEENILPEEVCEDLFDIQKLTNRIETVKLFNKYRNLRKIA